MTFKLDHFTHGILLGYLVLDLFRTAEFNSTS
jgi:hypothetical protein